MDFSRPIERGDGNCAVSIPFVRRVIRYEMNEGGGEKKRKEKKRAWKLRAYRFIFLKQRMAYSLPTNSNLETYQAGGSTYFARHRRIANTNTYSLGSRMKTTDYIYIYIYLYPRSKFQAWKKRKEKKRGKGKKKSSFSSSLWPLGNIHGFILNGLKVLESAKVDKER